MRRFLIALGLLLCGVSAGLAARQTVVNYFAEYFDYELPAAPCQTFEAPHPVSHVDQVLLFYACTDGRTLVRTFTVPAVRIEKELPGDPPPPSLPQIPGYPFMPTGATPPANSSDAVSCPVSGHRACACLPTGSYSAAWLNTVGCGR